MMVLLIWTIYMRCVISHFDFIFLLIFFFQSILISGEVICFSVEGFSQNTTVMLMERVVLNEIFCRTPIEKKIKATITNILLSVVLIAYICIIISIISASKLIKAGESQCFIFVHIPNELSVLSLLPHWYPNI